MQIWQKLYRYVTRQPEQADERRTAFAFERNGGVYGTAL